MPGIQMNQDFGHMVYDPKYTHVFGQVPEPSLQFEKSRGDEFCDESLDEVAAVA